MADLTDYNRRQLGKMAERLNLFTKGDLPLRVLIADLEFLLNAMEGIDASVQRQLRERWEVLEEVYSVAVGLHGGKLDSHAELLIRDAVVGLRACVGELVGTETFEE